MTPVANAATRRVSKPVKSALHVDTILRGGELVMSDDLDALASSGEDSLLFGECKCIRTSENGSATVILPNRVQDGMVDACKSRVAHQS